MISISPKSKLLVFGSPYFIDNAAGEAADSASQARADIYKLNGGEFSYGVLRDAVSIPSLFSAFTFVILKRAEELKEGIEKVATLLNASDTAYMVASSEIKSFDLLRRSLTGAHILEEDVSDAGKAREVVRLFAGEGLELNEQAAKKLGEDADWDFARIRSEAGKWALFLHGRKVSSHEILNIFAEDTDSGNLWHFLKLFMLKRRVECVKMLADFKDREGEARTLFFRLSDNLMALYFSLAHPKSRYLESRLKPNAYYAIKNTISECRALWQEEGAKRLIALSKELQLDMVTGRLVRGSEWTDILLRMVGAL